MVRLNYRNQGYVGEMLKSFLEKEDPVHWVRIALTYPGRFTETDWYSEGNFRPDALEIARAFVKDDQEYNDKKGFLPSGWEQQILNAEGPTIEIKGTRGLALKVGTLDMKRVAEIARGGYVSNPRRDEDRRQMLTREDLMVEFRGSIADQLINSNKYGDVTKMWQAPNEEELTKMINGAGQVYDHYISIPEGSLMVTKDFIFPYVIGRKKFPDLRWKGYRRFCGQSWKGARIPTSDVCVHLTGVEKDCAPHIMPNPVFRANFGFSMDVIGETFAVPKNEERDYVATVVESMGSFASIWVQNPTDDILNESGMTVNDCHDWYPTKDELIRACELHVGIKK